MYKHNSDRAHILLYAKQLAFHQSWIFYAFMTHGGKKT